jgi:catechol 2,3-dioxygenase-like lactoylglutathione lyase family enzyme
MANLEHLRKQAKLYLRWRREGYFPVAAQIRRHLARFAHLSDHQVLQAEFKLGDAQELVARKHGFDNWPALTKGYESMTASKTPGEAVILAAEPQLFTADIERACRYYVDVLGFTVAFAYGEPPFYAQVVRDGARLNLRHIEGPVFDPGLREREGDVLAATLTLDDAKPLFLEFQAAGAVFHQTLRAEPWGARTFIVADPDGNLVCFAGSEA